MRRRFRRPAAAAALCAAAVAAAVAALALDFVRRSQDSRRIDGTPPAVVFTGQFDRVHRGLDLLAAGRVERLLVSGANPGAGIAPGRFARQFGLGPDLRADLAEGRIALGTRAGTTLGNARETACWLRATGATGPVLLITSRRHLPRASLALERAVPGRRVLRLAPGPGAAPAGLFWREFAAFAATWALTLPPSGQDPRCP